MYRIGKIFASYGRKNAKRNQLKPFEVKNTIKASPHPVIKRVAKNNSDSGNVPDRIKLQHRA